MDDDIATVGTANLDNRSLALNFEITAVIHSPSACAEVKAMLEQDFPPPRRNPWRITTTNPWASKCSATWRD